MKTESYGQDPRLVAYNEWLARKPRGIKGDETLRKKLEKNWRQEGVEAGYIAIPMHAHGKESGATYWGCRCARCREACNIAKKARRARNPEKRRYVSMKDIVAGVYD